MKKLSFLAPFIAGVFIAVSSCAQKNTEENLILNQQQKEMALKKAAQQKWVDSVYNSLSQRERIGQLFMVAAYSGGKNKNSELIDRLIENRQIGGVIFMQGTAAEQAVLTNRFQKKAQVPLLIGMDAEWGLGMRLTGIKNLPKQMTLGATNNPKLSYELGKIVAEQCKRLGVHIDFAPVVDVNNNPLNPIINFRSFGDDKDLVTRMGIGYMKGLQENGVMASAKHFPGHGDVSVDSHEDMPIINKSKEELMNMELYPFSKLIKEGVQSVLVAHLHVPVIDNTPHASSTISRKIITDLLKKEMGFNGLVFTDALNMSGLTKYYPNGETDLRAFLAGNDVLLFSQDVPLAIQKIEKAIQSNKEREKDLENSVKKILAAKYDAGLNDFKEIDVENIDEDINQYTNDFIEKVAKNAVTLIDDKEGLLEKTKDANASLSYLSINNKGVDYFAQELKKSFKNVKAVHSAANSSDLLVVGIHSYATYPGKSKLYGLSTADIQLIKKLSKRKNTIFVVMGNAYLAQYLCDAGTTIVTYENNEIFERSAAQVISHQLKAKGKLPVHPCQK